MSLILFLLSGFTALLYQVVWQRLLGLFSGADVYAATITRRRVHGRPGLRKPRRRMGGRSVDQARQSGWLSPAAELAVGVFGFFSAALLLRRPLSAVRAIWRRRPRSAGPAVRQPALADLLHGNVAAAARAGADADDRRRRADHWRALRRECAGCERWRASHHVVATAERRSRRQPAYQRVAEIGVAIAAGLLATQVAARAVQAVRTPPPRRSPGRRRRHSGSLSFPVWLGLYCLSGFLALSLEIVWFRTLGVIAKATAFTFGTLLAVYLGGWDSGPALAADSRAGFATRR